MIQIDIPMPKRCAECPCFDDTVYGKCNVKDIWLGAEDGAWFSERRPSWCPLIENDGGQDGSDRTIPAQVQGMRKEV